MSETTGNADVDLIRAALESWEAGGGCFGEGSYSHDNGCASVDEALNRIEARARREATALRWAVDFMADQGWDFGSEDPDDEDYDALSLLTEIHRAALDALSESEEERVPYSGSQGPGDYSGPRLGDGT